VCGTEQKVPAVLGDSAQDEAMVLFGSCASSLSKTLRVLLCGPTQRSLLPNAAHQAMNLEKAIPLRTPSSAALLSDMGLELSPGSPLAGVLPPHGFVSEPLARVARVDVGSGGGIPTQRPGEDR